MRRANSVRASRALASTLALTAVLAALGPLGCGSTVTDGGAGGSAAAAATAGCPEYAAATCARGARCEPNLQWTQYLGSAAACEAAEARFCEARLRAPDTGATPAWFGACVRASAESSCGSWPSACNFPRGRRAAGAPCIEGVQCASGSCAVAPGATCGTCTEERPLGAPCDAENRCGGDAYCGKNGCVAMALPGEACDALHACVGSSGCVAGVCAPELAEGVACDPAQDLCDFATALVCDPASRTCTATHVPGPGAACGAGSSSVPGCAGGPCANGTCVAWRGEGEACVASSNDAMCGGWLTCVGGVCAYPPASACD